jgi:CSLREA domain-containing protein
MATGAPSLALATNFVVTTTADSYVEGDGVCSLREAARGNHGPLPRVSSPSAGQDTNVRLPLARSTKTNRPLLPSAINARRATGAGAMHGATPIGGTAAHGVRRHDGAITRREVYRHQRVGGSDQSARHREWLS